MYRLVGLVTLVMYFHSFSVKNTFIDYFEKRGYRCIECKSYQEIINKIDSKSTRTKEIIYINRDSVVFGFLSFEDFDQPQLFVFDNKALTLFLSDPMIDNEIKFYDKILSNMVSAYHLNFEKRERSYIIFNYGFPSNKVFNETYKMDGDKCFRSKSKCETIPYPVFSDTTKVATNYKKFYNVDLPECWKETKFSEQQCPDSFMYEMLNDLLR